jgi:hypothetical protein
MIYIEILYSKWSRIARHESRVRPAYRFEEFEHRRWFERSVTRVWFYHAENSENPTREFGSHLRNRRLCCQDHSQCR